MIPVPFWALEVIHTTACVPCDHLYREADVTGIGMRHVGEGKVCLTIQVECPRCHRHEPLAILKRPMDIRAFVAEIAELGEVDDYREWAVSNATLRFYPEKPTDRLTAVHHVHTNGEGWSDPRHTELRLCSSLTPCGVKMRVTGMGTRVPEAHLDVLGGYCAESDTIILYRHGTAKIPVHDGFLKLLPNRRVELRGFESERLEPSDWTRFGGLSQDQLFQLGGRPWRKMSQSALHSVVGDHVWAVSKVRLRP
jgi:hypothetical protein